MEPFGYLTSYRHSNDASDAAILRARFTDAGPLLLLATMALLTVGALTATHLRGERDLTPLFAAFGAGGMPMISYWTPPRCHAPAANSSAIRLDRNELVALLERK